MNDFKLKVVLAILSALVFSFVFILLAFLLPPANEEVEKKAPKTFKHVTLQHKN